MAIALPLTPQMTEQVRRIDLTLLFPPFADLYLELLDRCAARGHVYYALSGFRSEAEQEVLYAKGRVRDGADWIVHNAPAIVTNAAPGTSDHQYGVGADSCLDKDADRAGLQPGWAMSDYRVLAEEARGLGLNALYWSQIFPEGPHVGLDLGKYGITTRQLLQIHRKGGQAAVWTFLWQHDWSPAG